MREVLHLNDAVIDFKITANRPDCQSVLGVAREVAVALEQEFHPPVPVYTTEGGDIRDHHRCHRGGQRPLPPVYGPGGEEPAASRESPEWMKLCLRAAGMRPINNIVDITNYVMLETGQPMHAFDLRDIRGSKIIVRRAKEGEAHHHPGRQTPYPDG